jgi:hypothetical protein
MQPHRALRVPAHHLGRLLRIVPVPRLQLVPGNTQLPSLTDRHDLPLAVDDLGPGVRHQMAHGAEFDVQRIVVARVEARGGRFGQAVRGGELAHAEAEDHELH